MNKFFNGNGLSFALVAVCLTVAGCQVPPTTTTQTSVNINANGTSVAVSNGNLSVNGNTVSLNTANNAAVETKEPEQYQANVSMRIETGGQQMMSFPKLTASVAKMGANRRTEFGFPNGEKIIYLEKDGKSYVISPNRKQFGELTKESTGFDVQSLMMPEQIVSRVKNLRGVERVGEEKINGRDVIKYQYVAVTDTKSQAGNVDTKAFVLVDKETGLPLVSEMNAASQNASVQGMNSLKIVTEMTDVKTMVDATLFDLPADYAKVAPEQIRQQINAAFAIATNLLTQLLKTNTPPTNSPAAGASPNANSNANSR